MSYEKRNDSTNRAMTNSEVVPYCGWITADQPNISLVYRPPTPEAIQQFYMPESPTFKVVQ